MMQSRTENQGSIQSVDPVQPEITVNGVTYPFHTDMEILLQTPDGVRRMRPEQLGPSTRVGIESPGGSARRIHILQSP